MENNEHIDGFLKNEFGQYKVEPKVNSFDEVLCKMEKRKRRMFLYFLIPGLAILVGVLAPLTYYSIKEANNNRIVNTTNQIKNRVSLNNGTNGEYRNSALRKVQALSRDEHGQPILRQFSDPASAPSQNKKETKTIKMAFSGKTPTDKAPDKTLAVAAFKPDAQPETVLNEAKTPELASVLSKEPLSAEPQKPIASEQPKSEQQLSNETPANEKIFAVDTIGAKPALVNAKVDTVHLVSSSPQDSTEKQDLQTPGFYFGFSALPGLGRNYITENSSSNGVNNSSPSFSKLYAESKNKQNKWRYNFGFALKFGQNIKNKWEWFVGLGYQLYKDKEQVFDYPFGLGSISYSFPVVQKAEADATQAYTNKFRYIFVCLEAGRILKVGKFSKIKPALAIHNNISVLSQTLLYSSYTHYFSDNNNKAISKYVCIPHFKCMFINDISRRVCMQVGPSVFYGINSAFGSHYYINQRNYGVAFECQLLFKL